jgi:site-specific DNA recombinase
VNQIESLRIVSDAVFQTAARRMHKCSDDDVRLKSGGRVKYLLSGLMSCASCGRNYVMADSRQYACGGYAYGETCKNSERVYRTELEAKIVRPVLDELRDPARVARMAKEMEAEFVRRIQAAEARATAAPVSCRR